MSHYNNAALENNEKNVDYLINYFGEDAEADEMNFVLFSTSGVHGGYTTIEDIEHSIKNNLKEEDDDYTRWLTVLIIRPRLVSCIYGQIEVTTLDEIEYLKKLRASSFKVLKELCNEGEV